MQVALNSCELWWCSPSFKRFSPGWERQKRSPSSHSASTQLFHKGAFKSLFSQTGPSCLVPRGLYLLGAPHPSVPPGEEERGGGGRNAAAQREDERHGVGFALSFGALTPARSQLCCPLCTGAASALNQGFDRQDGHTL